jgi:ketosteroid isomerase-like protein
MQRLLAVILTAAVVNNANCQNFQKEINDQVWKPFISSFNAHDTKVFMAVHSKELVRSSRDSKVVLGWDEYSKQQHTGDQREKDNGTERIIELRFAERIANSNQAIDVGIYKTTVTNKEGKTASYFGRFHVVLRKEGNTWRILVDTDSSEKNTIGEDDFLSALPIE